MSKITASGLIKIQNILSENDLQLNQIVDISIGNDNKIYIFFSEIVPERINGMFVPTVHHSRYKSISFDVNWHSGEVYGSSLIDLGSHSVNIHFMLPIGENFLLLGARAMLYKDGNADENAVIVDRHGNKVRSFCLGDGIQNCIVDSQNNIITGYFDEGVFGNNGWYNPIGAPGIVKWSEIGEKLWENKRYAICDCYAMNIDEQDNLWFYYYTDFNLVKTNYQSDIVYVPNINGSNGFLISKSQTALLFHKGYGEKDFCLMKKNHNYLSNPSEIRIVYADSEIDIGLFSFRSSKAVFVSTNGELFFLDWI